MCSVSQASQTSQNLKIVQFWFLHEGNRTCCTYCGHDPLKKIKNIFRNQRREATLLLTEVLAARSLSLDNSISIFAWIFSQSTSTWKTQ